VFRSDALLVVTTEATLAETKERLPILAAKYRLTRPAVSAQLAALPVDVVPESRYRSHLAEAHRYLGARDPSDVPLAALALKLEIPIWSNDRDFEELPLIVYPTAKLLKLLGL
jgi:predicted nucleic acid-binding protein